MARPTYKYVEDYLNAIRAKGRYGVTLAELQNSFDSSEKAIKQSIYRLKSKNQLAQVRKEFYVIVPPQYSHRGMVPPTLFIDDLMQYLKRQYYIGLFSASALHGAGHQQPMQFQVMTKKPPLRSINNKKLSLHFFVKSKWQDSSVFEKKTEAGFVKVSSPALTAFDLVHYNKKIGGLNRIIPILEDLIEGIRTSDLNKTSMNQRIPDMQRLGYLLDQLGNEKLASILLKRIEGESLRKVPISLAHKTRQGDFNKKWRVILNTTLDF